jgi:peptidoglycan-N-acetylglucosamine deacetylase
MFGRSKKKLCKPVSAFRLFCASALFVAAGLFLARPLSAASILEFRVISAVPMDNKLVALTFDDGPHPIYTRQVLDALDAYGAKATFFMVGAEMEKYPEVVKEVLKRGHSIGNHTLTHPHDLRDLPEKEAVLEIEMCGRTIEKMTGTRPTLFRPPRGRINTAILNAAEKNGYKVIYWTVSADHHEATTPELMAKRAINKTRPGAIILIHDGFSSIHWKDVAATSLILEDLSKKGYRFVTIPELLKYKRGSEIYNHFMTLFYIFS